MASFMATISAGVGCAGVLLRPLVGGRRRAAARRAWADWSSVAKVVPFDLG